MATTEARAGAGSSRASANMAPPASIPAASTTTRSEHGRASRHEESGLMSDEDFYDAQEDLEADASRQASVGGFWVALYGQEVGANQGGILAAIVPSNKQAGGPELEDKRIDPDDSKYIVKNKDTGEVFDIRDLASMPADSYSIFPNDFVAPQEEETVRLWHISREDCLHVFHHPDSVPAVDFHPKEDRYFLSGCFDNKARVWDIPDGCVVSYVQTPVMITAASFNPSGTRAIVGLLNGQCIFYQVNSHQQMNYYTQIECRNSRGSMRKGRKVTGIEFDPEGKYFLYKGLVNGHLQIKGRFSQDGDFVICGSENGSVYVWNKARYLRSSIVKSSKQDRNASYEFFTAAEPPNGIVTVALFAPASTFAMVKSKLEASDDVNTNACTGLIVSASYDGCIKFFERSAKSV
ncbi:WD40-repeat-containing domain [Phytophthora cactorum]|nr:WD40-repeat-containing domain [Phytophthora cactorum]